MGNFNVVVTYPSELEFDKSTYDIRGTELRIVQDNDPISVDIRTCAAFLDEDGYPIDLESDDRQGYFQDYDFGIYRNFCVELIGEFNTIEEARQFVAENFTLGGQFSPLESMVKEGVIVDPDVEKEIKAGKGEILEYHPIWISTRDPGYKEALGEYMSSDGIVSEKTTPEEIKKFAKEYEEEFRSYGVVAFADLIEEEIKEAIEDERQERLASERQWDDLER